MKNAYYWDAERWQVNQEGFGKEIHPLVALFAAITLGGLFVVFLPFIGLYLFGKQVAVTLASPVKDLFQTSVTPTAAPGMAHFTGTPGKDDKGNSLEELSKEINDKRAQ